MLTNSAVGGIVVAAYLTVLVLHLNPALELRPDRSIPLFLTMALFYGVHAAALFYLLIVARQLVAVEVLSPGWLSVRLLVWLFAGASSVGGALMWMNLASFRAALDPRVAERVTAAALALTVCAACLFALAWLHYSFGRQGSRASAGLLALFAAASFVVPLVARGPAIDPRSGLSPPLARAIRVPIDAQPGVTMILLDGASLEFIAPTAAEGRLPNLGNLLDGGAVMHLATLQPTQPAPVWTAVATGKLPYKHGIRSAATYAFRGGRRPIERLPDYCYAQALVRFGFLKEEPYTSAAVSARPLWDIVGSFGVSVGIIGWPLTFPATEVHGYLVSDEIFRISDERILLDGNTALAYPERVLPLALAARAAPRTNPVGSWLSVSAERPSEGNPAEVTAALAEDLVFEEMATALQRTIPTQMTAVRYPGLDAVGHRYLRYAVPEAFGDVSDEERRRYGRVLEQYYAHLDAVIGRAVAELRPDDLLLVVSGFGMDPLSPGKRLLERAFGTPSLSGTHEGAPDGFLIAYGGPVRAGRLDRGSVLDVAPTVLYFLGLPVARDMDGDARADLFEEPFTTQRPITFIPTYDDQRVIGNE
jgi:hypothetical protein